MADYVKIEKDVDVLVIGGGIAAFFAALRAKAAGADVLVIDKGSIGRSGQTPFASAMGIFDEDAGDDRETWYKNMAENAKNLNNPYYLDNFMDYSKTIYEELVSWGATDVGFGKVFRDKILSEDINVLERTMVTHLLEDGGKIGGAIGFKLDDGEAVVVKAVSVILCTGAGGFKPNGFQICSLTFDGDAMAYRIGAEISGKEFVDTHFTFADTPAYCWGQWSGMWSQGLPVINNPLIEGGGKALDLSSYHTIHEDGISVSSDSSNMMGPGEMSEDGERQGPPSGEDGEMSADGERPEPPTGEDGEMMEPPTGEDGEMMEPPTDGEMPEGGGRNNASSNIGGASAGLSVHKAEGLFPADNKCGTSIKGLYAAGDCLSSMLVGPIYNGVAGFSSTGSATQGALAGEVAAEYIKNNTKTSIADARVTELIEEMFEPLNSEQGYSPGWVEHILQGALIPYYVLYIKREDRLNAALTNINFFSEHFGSNLRADDLHDLRKAHEVKNMLLNAQMKLRASLYRTESRGNHYREDYPEADDSWLAWVVIKKDDNGEMELSKFMIEDFKDRVI